MRTCAEGKIKFVKTLLNKGADVNSEDYYGNTPLIVASSNGFLEVVKLCVEYGADVNHKAKNGYLPINIDPENRGWFDTCDIYISKQVEIANYLIENGAIRNIDEFLYDKFEVNCDFFEYYEHYPLYSEYTGVGD
eukprot:GHVR01030080.1.p1 GENE.GHVR01030080.1~~GHVR01030080.1.p1  ORF type:complete len:135 (-),score=15.28 GHVR01030080.1:923-1327(-)